uniref:Uncharacterized protein n=1 Tax=Oryza nivara TaxID=4536 RepID=A0A0E0I4W8_ORYNI
MPIPSVFKAIPAV